MNLPEIIARTLAWRTAEHSANGGMTTIDEADYWDMVLTERLRDHYRALAKEILGIVSSRRIVLTDSDGDKWFLIAREEGSQLTSSLPRMIEDYGPLKWETL